MSQHYVTGPAAFFLGWGPGGGRAKPSVIRFLGWTERTPVILIRPQNEPVFNAVGGTRIPADFAYQGEEALVLGDFIRFNEITYTALACGVRAGLFLANPGATVRGVDFWGDVGALYVQDNNALHLYVTFPYSTKASQSTMPSGYHFIRSVRIGPDELSSLGTVPRKNKLVWHCIRELDLKTGNQKLYDHNTSGLPPVD